MRILYFHKEFLTSMYQWQHVHILDELQHHNCFVDVFNPLDYSSLDEANEKLVQKCKVYKYDLFMTPHNEEVIYINTIRDIKSLGIPTLLICFDSLMTPLKHKNVAPLFDAVMISQKDEKGIFSSYNKNTIVSHYAANPFYFKADCKVKEIMRICFPGTPYGSRMVELVKLANNKIPLDLYYNQNTENNNITKSKRDLFEKARTISQLLRYEEGRKVLEGAALSKIKKKVFFDPITSDVNIAPSVNLKETNQIYASHALSLSIGIGRNTGYLKNPIQIVHLRNFEIPMSGGVQFCQYFDELSECFEENKEIIFYRSQEEMLEKARYYLLPENETIRKKIRIAARKRAEAEHTWWNRFSKAFDKIGIKY